MSSASTPEAVPESVEAILEKARETGNLPDIEGSVPFIRDIHNAQAIVHGDIIRFVERLILLSPAPVGHAAVASDECRQLLLRIKSNVQHLRDSNDAQKDILDHIVRTSREQKAVIAKLQSDSETLREGEDKDEPIDRDEELRDQRRKSIEKARAAKVARRERRKSRPSNESLRNQHGNPPAQRKLPDAMAGVEAEHDGNEQAIPAPRLRSSRGSGIVSYAEEAAEAD